MTESLARIKIRIKIPDIGQAQGELNRLTAPLTVGELMKRLPINSRTIPSQGCVSVLIGLKKGVEKPVNHVEAGTIAYWPQAGSICIFPAATRTFGPVNRVGTISDNLEIFKNLKSGTRIIIEAV